MKAKEILAANMEFFESISVNSHLTVKRYRNHSSPVFFIFSLIFVDLRSLGGEFRMAVNIRLKYGNFEQDLNKHIDSFEYVVLS